MPAKKQPETLKGLRITTKQDGFRRAGREWHGTTELAVDKLTEDELKQIKAEPKLVIQEIEIPVEETAEESGE